MYSLPNSSIIRLAYFRSKYSTLTCRENPFSAHRAVLCQSETQTSLKNRVRSCTCKHHQSQNKYLRKLNFRLLFPNSSGKYLGNTNQPWVLVTSVTKSCTCPVEVEKSGRKRVNCKTIHTGNQNTYWEPSPRKVVVICH